MTGVSRFSNRAGSVPQQMPILIESGSGGTESALPRRMNRTEIAALAVGMKLEQTFDVEAFSGFTKLKPGARYFSAKRITKITCRKENVKGQLFVMGELEFGENSTITFSLTEGELLYRVQP
jgi:hypothetical protein